MVKIIPLGGLGEIGLNMMVFESGDSGIVVDAGLMFPEDYMLGWISSFPTCPTSAEQVPHPRHRADPRP